MSGWRTTWLVSDPAQQHRVIKRTQESFAPAHVRTRTRLQSETANEIKERELFSRGLGGESDGPPPSQRVYKTSTRSVKRLLMSPVMLWSLTPRLRTLWLQFNERLTRLTERVRSARSANKRWCHREREFTTTSCASGAGVCTPSSSCADLWPKFYSLFNIFSFSCLSFSHLTYLFNFNLFIFVKKCLQSFRRLWVVLAVHKSKRSAHLAYGYWDF